MTREENELVSEGLEQAADKYVFGFHPSIQRMCKECYIDGANWQKEQMMKDAVERVNKKMITRAIAWVEWNSRNGYCLFDGWKENLREAMKGE